jgi:hypothetical protein
VGAPPALLRLKKEQMFIKRVKAIDRFEHEREPFMNRLLRTLQASGGPAFVQLAMTPAHPGFERHAKRLYKRHEHRLSRERGDGLLEPRLDRSMVEDAELRGGLDVQHRPLFFVDVRVVAGDRSGCERIASALRAEVAENRLVERGTDVRHGLLGIYCARVIRGEGNPLPSKRKGVFVAMLAYDRKSTLWDAARLLSVGPEGYAYRETVACWQVNAQWVEREVRDQLDALFAHRVYFATASVEDARESASITMAQFSDLLRPGIGQLSVLGHPDARLHLPKHHAIASWSAPAGRQLPFVGRTIPLRVDPGRLAWHAAR